MSKIDVVIDTNAKHVISMSVDIGLVVKGELDLSDLITKAFVEQLRGKVAVIRHGNYTVRAFCTVVEQPDGASKS